MIRYRFPARIHLIKDHFVFGYISVLDFARKQVHSKMKFSIKDFFRKCDQIWSFQRIWPHLLQKTLMENFFFCVVISVTHPTAFMRRNGCGWGYIVVRLTSELASGTNERYVTIRRARLWRTTKGVFDRDDFNWMNMHHSSLFLECLLLQTFLKCSLTFWQPQFSEKQWLGVLRKRYSWKFDKPHRKTPVLESRFSKIADKDIPTQLFCW